MKTPVSMRIDAIWETMQSTPTTSVLLILFMSIAAALLINHILKASFYTTLSSIPVLLIAGVCANAVLTVHGVPLVPDKASNTALSAAVGFVAIASFTFASLRIWSRLHDRR